MRDPKDQLAAVAAGFVVGDRAEYRTDAKNEPVPDGREARSIDLAQFMRRQIEWSTATFGPGERSMGLVDHVWRELREVMRAQTPEDELTEWVDVVLLALDAAWRLGFTPEDVCRAMLAKAEKNRARRWPDWRTADLWRAIEHVREPEE